MPNRVHRDPALPYGRAPRDEIERVRSVLRGFLDRVFHGEVPEGVADPVALRGVARVLMDGPLVAAEAAHWGRAPKRALYEMLAAAIVELRLAPSVFDADFLAGSNLEALDGPLARWLADKRDSPLLYSRTMH